MQLTPNSTALSFDSARRRAPAACGRRDWSASGAASDVGDLRRPTHRLAIREGVMDTSATNCLHTPACVRVRAQVPCLYGAALQWWPALSRLCGARCRQTCCGATVVAVHSSRRPTRTPASPGCALSRARSFARPPCPQRTAPKRPARAALRRPRRRSERRPVLSVVRRSLAQVAWSRRTRCPLPGLRPVPGPCPCPAEARGTPPAAAAARLPVVCGGRMPLVVFVDSSFGRA